MIHFFKILEIKKRILYGFFISFFSFFLLSPFHKIKASSLKDIQESIIKDLAEDIITEATSGDDEESPQKELAAKANPAKANPAKANTAKVPGKEIPLIREEYLSDADIERLTNDIERNYLQIKEGPKSNEDRFIKRLIIKLKSSNPFIIRVDLDIDWIENLSGIYGYETFYKSGKKKIIWLGPKKITPTSPTTRYIIRKYQLERILKGLLKKIYTKSFVSDYPHILDYVLDMENYSNYAVGYIPDKNNRMLGMPDNNPGDRREENNLTPLKLENFLNPQDTIIPINPKKDLTQIEDGNYYPNVFFATKGLPELLISLFHPDFKKPTAPSQITVQKDDLKNYFYQLIENLEIGLDTVEASSGIGKVLMARLSLIKQGGLFSKNTYSSSDDE